MIITVSREEALRLRVVAHLRDTRWGGTVTQVESVGEAEELLRRTGSARVILVDRSIGLPGAAELAAAAANLRQPPPILLVDDPSTEVLRSAMRAGIRDVLPPDFEAADLVSAFEDAGVSSDGPKPLPGLTVAVFSTKGGVGTSVVASNLAVRLGELVGVDTTLVDLDLASADQAIMHGLSPRWTIQDLVDGAVGSDVESLRQVLVPVKDTRVRVLPGPVDPALSETISGSDVSAIIASARAEASVVVLDTSSNFDDRTLAALDAADVVVVTSSLDVAALRSLAVSLQTLSRLGLATERLKIALVRSDSKSGLLTADVERTIERPVDVGVPSTRAVPRSVNEGVPLAVSSTRAGVVEAIDELVERVLPFGAETLEESYEPDSGGFFPWSRKRRSSSGDGDGDAGSGSVVERVEAQQPSERAEPDVDEEPEAVDEDQRDATPGGPAVGQGAPEQAGDHEASVVEHDEADDEGDEMVDNVLPIERSRPTEGSSTRRRVVRPRAPEPPQEGEEGDEGDESDVPLSDLPPPIVVSDDDDDQPRRRRRR